jgi:hypothetical protein
MGFNLDDYEPVAARLARWLEWAKINDLVPSVITDLVHYSENRAVFKAELILTSNTNGATWTVATGWAEETRGDGHVNKTSHLENAESSAVGRALANAGLAGSDPNKRPSREEMQKVIRAGGSPAPTSDDRPRTFPNKFAKACVNCGEIVEAGAGVAWKEGEKFKTAHKDACIEAPF